MTVIIRIMIVIILTIVSKLCSISVISCKKYSYMYMYAIVLQFKVNNKCIAGLLALSSVYIGNKYVIMDYWLFALTIILAMVLHFICH